MSGIGKFLAGVMLAACWVAPAVAGHKLKDPNDGMVFVRSVGWVYPDLRCVNGEVYDGHGRPTGTQFYVSVDRKVHECGPPEVISPLCDGECPKPKAKVR